MKKFPLTLLILLPGNAGILMLNTLLFNISSLRIWAYITGSLFYFLMLKFSHHCSTEFPDYIQGGEAPLSSLIVLISLVMFPAPCYWIFAVISLLIIGYEYYLHAVLKLKLREIKLVSMAFFALFTFLAYYLTVSRSIFSVGFLEHALLSYEKVYSGNIYVLSFAFCAWILLYVLILKTRPNICLFSLGEYYFSMSGKDYKKALVLIHSIRGVLSTLVFFFSGWLNGAGIFLKRSRLKKDVIYDIESILYCVLYVQILAALVNINIFFAYLSPVLFFGTYIYTGKKR